MKSLGTIPAHSARPVKLYFERKNVNADSIDTNDWNIAFDAKLNVARRVKVQYEDLPEGISLEDKLVYDNFLKELPELQEGQFTISTFSIGMQKEGNIIVSLVMRNAADKPFGIGRLPVTLRDGNGVVIFSEEFELTNFKVNPIRAKICNIMFPTSVKIEEDMELKNWSVSFNLEQVGTKR
ncbi:SLAP domain-containing protein [Clostridium sp. OS1-26]|uniref:SLAP domain-containing protein n=1 Tax=Clostridium sp. OS1-26 TaxID=3070681 RepID=UPI0027E05579|nr:SLAP domain-containing protein [Clostridium sp. OS1-26]WML36737.1 SLAP domain-containing protein [Clostridium sp. OS1-26]